MWSVNRASVFFISVLLEAFRLWDMRLKRVWEGKAKVVEFSRLWEVAVCASSSMRSDGSAPATLSHLIKKDHFRRY